MKERWSESYRGMDASGMYHRLVVIRRHGDLEVTGAQCNSRIRLFGLAVKRSEAKSNGNLCKQCLLRQYEEAQ